MKQYKVEENEKEKRIDAYISQREEGLSRTAIKRLIDEGAITVNVINKKSSYKVSKYDII